MREENFSARAGLARRRAGPLAAAAMAVVVCGCTSTYVDLPKVSIVKSTQFTTLEKAVTDFEEQRTENVQGARNKEANYRKAIAAITFGAIAGGGIAALYDAHRDVVLGFGLAGATAYSGGTLFWSAERGSNLNSANAALQCVTRTGAGIIGAEASFTETEKKMNGLREGMENWCSATSAGNEALEAADKAKTNLRAFRKLDGVFASQVTNAASTIINALNEKLDALAPTPASALRAGQSITQFATGFVSRVTPKPAVPKVSQAPPPPGSKCLQPDPAVAKELKEMSEALDKALADRTNEMAALATQCVFNGEGPKTLTASPDAANIAKDVTVTIAVTGAFGLPSIQWPKGEPASNELQVTVESPTRISVKGNSQLPGNNKKYEFEVIDQRPVGTPVKVTITGPA